MLEFLEKEQIDKGIIQGIREYREKYPAAGTMAEQKGRVLSWTRRILSNNFPIVTLPASWLR